jgi:hypothetical protein
MPGLAKAAKYLPSHSVQVMWHASHEFLGYHQRASSLSSCKHQNEDHLEHMTSATLTIECHLGLQCTAKNKQIENRST